MAILYGIVHAGIVFLSLINQIAENSASEKDITPIMIIERIDLVYINKQYANCNITLSKINRKLFGITVYADIYENATKLVDNKQIFVELQSYAWYSNTYREMPLHIKKELCSLLNYEYKLYARNLEIYSQFKFTCPMKPGSYSLVNYTFDATKFPELPWKKIMSQVRVFSSDGLTLAITKVYVINNQEYIKYL